MPPTRPLYPAPPRSRHTAEPAATPLAPFEPEFSSTTCGSLRKLQLQLRGLHDLNLQPERVAVPRVVRFLERAPGERGRFQPSWRVAQLKHQIHTRYGGSNVN